MKWRFFKKKRQVKVILTMEELLEELISRIFWIENSPRLEVVINQITIKGAFMKYKVSRNDFPIKVKLKPEDEQNNLVGISKGSAKFSTDVDGVVTVTQDPDDEEAAVLNYAGPGKVQILTKSMSVDGQHSVNTVDSFEVTENEETKAETSFTNAAGSPLVGEPEDVAAVATT
jgi:hypothetical protein